MMFISFLIDEVMIGVSTPHSSAYRVQTGKTVSLEGVTRPFGRYASNEDTAAKTI
jgi:hypothetical protein